MTENTRKVLKERLEKIVSKLAYNDMMQHKKSLTKAKQKNYKGGYSLSNDTEEAQENYSIVCKPVEYITLQEEEQVKGYLLKQNLLSLP